MNAALKRFEDRDFNPAVSDPQVNDITIPCLERKKGYSSFNNRCSTRVFRAEKVDIKQRIKIVTDASCKGPTVLGAYLYHWLTTVCWP